MWQNDIFGMTSEDDVVTLLNIYCSSMAEKKQGMYCSSMLEKKNPNRLFTPKEKKGIIMLHNLWESTVKIL